MVHIYLTPVVNIDCDNVDVDLYLTYSIGDFHIVSCAVSKSQGTRMLRLSYS